jgi:O-antigen ligase
VPSRSFAFLAGLMVLVWCAGGASRADVIGQVVTRAGAWAILVAIFLFLPRPQLRLRDPIVVFVACAIALTALQLIPLPPSIWSALPGRELFLQAATVTLQEQSWRPLSISPSATVNALSSLIVPLVVLILISGLSPVEHKRVVMLLLGLVFLSSILGLLQFSGARLDHPMVNDVRGEISATFANRNHFALFAAFGCLLAPVWASFDVQNRRWGVPAAIGLQLFFALIILATGSRMGMIVGGLAVLIGFFLIRHQVVQELRRLSPKVAALLAFAGVAMFVAVIALSIISGRAVSLQRAFTLDAAADLRSQSFPTVLGMIERYFPAGSGFGAFDPIYRISEPDHLLQLAYFNHAHNDWLEILLDGGLPGLLLLVAAVCWWAVKSARAWRGSGGSSATLARLGSAVLALIMIASLTDYPARTPMIMAIIVVAAWWLKGGVAYDRAPAS